MENKKINGKQFTITWHIDNLKKSHIDKAVVGWILQKLYDEFGKNSSLMTSSGKIFEYLGITIDYRQKGKVQFSLKEYIRNILGECHTT